MDQQQSSSSPPAPGTTARGRGNRGRGGKLRTSRKEAAESQINLNARPVSFNGDWLGFNPVKRGNALVTVDHQVTERAAADYKTVLQNVITSKGVLDRTSKALGLDAIANGLAAGLCLAWAVKFIQATPLSKLSDISYFHAFHTYTTYVPKTFVQLLDISGKCDYQDWVVRIENNSTLIRRLMLKAIGYCSRIKDFTDRYVYFENSDDLAKFKKLPKNPMDYANIVFADLHSLKEIKRFAKEFLDVNLAKDIVLTIDSSSVIFSYPQLPAILNSSTIAGWLAKFSNNEAIHPGAQNLMGAGCMLLADMRWLENPFAKLSDLDPENFKGKVSDLTPVDILNHFNCYHQYQFISDHHFKQFVDYAFSYYSGEVETAIHTHLDMVSQGVSNFGDIAQIVTVDDEFIRRVPATMADGFERTDLDPLCKTSNCFSRLHVADKVLTSSVFLYAKEVVMEPDYEAHATVSFRTSRKVFLSKDSIVWARSKVFI